MAGWSVVSRKCTSSSFAGDVSTQKRAFIVMGSRDISQLCANSILQEKPRRNEQTNHTNHPSGGCELPSFFLFIYFSSFTILVVGIFLSFIGLLAIDLFVRLVRLQIH